MSTKFLKIEFDNLVNYLQNNPGYTNPNLWDEFLAKGNNIKTNFLDEVLDNMKRGTTFECMVYLDELKRMLLRLFEPASIKTTTENNLLAYVFQQQDFDEIDKLIQGEILAEVFAETIPQPSLNDLTLEKQEFLKKNLRKRRIGVLAYVGSAPKEREAFIKKFEISPLGNDFHEAIYYNISPDEIKNVQLKNLLIIARKMELDDQKTNLLRIVTGLTIYLLTILRSLTKDANHYLKEESDLITILSILRQNNIISASNSWQEFTIINEMGSYKTYNSTSSMYTLISVLAAKGYLKNAKRKTTIRRAFCKTFRIESKDRNLRNSSSSQNDLLEYFSKIIPNK